MIDPKILRENIEKLSENLKKRNFELKKDVFLKIDNNRKEIIVKTEDLKNKRNLLSKEIGVLKSKDENTDHLVRKAEDINNDLAHIETELASAEHEFKNFLLNIPNILDDSVPVGKSESNNKIIKYSNDENLEEKPKGDFKDHSDIGKSLNLYDHEIASKISSSRFSLLFGNLAVLHRALSSFMINEHINNHGYTEVNVPLIVNSNSLLGTGQLPKFKDDLFEIKNKDNFFLIPTAEVPLTNIFRDTVLTEDDLPIKYAALSCCFRSEAGSYGKDTKGLIRQHQFEKVELVNAVNPNNSDDYLEKLTSDAEKILVLLGLPYRKILLCSGDTGFSSSKTYDLEVWMPSQNKYREISSCSNFKDFQSRRLNIKFKEKSSKKKQYIHTLNGSGLAVGRTLAAVIENFQDISGNVEIPDVLRPYMNNLKFIKKKNND
tara:strand:+ start:1221 stop:2519 length:1299 start_codon:yes stop_codon:yes gene_type:complete